MFLISSWTEILYVSGNYIKKTMHYSSPGFNLFLLSQPVFFEANKKISFSHSHENSLEEKLNYCRELSTELVKVELKVTDDFET